MQLLEGIRSIDELKINNQRVLIRADLDSAGQTEDQQALTRLSLQALLPTLQLAAEQEARIIIAAHRGDGTNQSSLENVAATLSELSGWDVFLPDDCLGDAVKRVIGDLRAGQVCMLENLRFHRGEIENDEGFARALAEWCEVYVNDAWSASLLRHASLSALPRLIPMRGCGLQLRREVEAIERIGSAGTRPVVGILGGAQSSEQLDQLELFLGRCDQVCVGGMLSTTLAVAGGADLGRTEVEQELLPRCRSLLDRHFEKLVLPVDWRTSDVRGPPRHIADAKRMPAGHSPLDIGPRTAETFARAFASAGSIVYTGLMSVTSEPAATEGTIEVLRGVAGAKGFSYLMGAPAVARFIAAKDELGDGIDHVSLGADTTLAFLAGKRLPAIDALRGASND